MTASYTFRPSVAASDATYTLVSSALITPTGTVPLAAVRSLRVYSIPGVRAATGVVTQPQGRCVIRADGYKSVTLSSLSFVSPGQFADLSQDFRNFVGQLALSLRSANPAARIFVGMASGLWWFWMLTFCALLALCAIVVLALLSLLIKQGFQWPLLVGVAVVLLIGIGPASFVRSTWRRRGRSATALPESLWA